MSSQANFDKAAGEALREARKAQGLSQEDLAVEANVDQSALSKAERIGPGAIGWARFCRIAEKLGLAIELRLVPDHKARSQTTK